MGGGGRTARLAPLQPPVEGSRRVPEGHGATHVPLASSVVLGGEHTHAPSESCALPGPHAATHCPETNSGRAGGHAHTPVELSSWPPGHVAWQFGVAGGHWHAPAAGGARTPEHEGAGFQAGGFGGAAGAAGAAARSDVAGGAGGDDPRAGHARDPRTCRQGPRRAGVGARPLLTGGRVTMLAPRAISGRGRRRDAHIGGRVERLRGVAAHCSGGAGLSGGGDGTAGAGGRAGYRRERGSRAAAVQDGKGTAARAAAGRPPGKPAGAPTPPLAQITVSYADKLPSQALRRGGAGRRWPHRTTRGCRWRRPCRRCCTSCTRRPRRRARTTCPSGTAGTLPWRGSCP
jgi:hypothetical protein